MTPLYPGDFIITIPLGLLLLIVFIVGFFTGVLVSGLILRQMGVRLSTKKEVRKRGPGRPRGSGKKKTEEKEKERESDKEKKFSGGRIPG